MPLLQNARPSGSSGMRVPTSSRSCFSNYKLIFLVVPSCQYILTMRNFEITPNPRPMRRMDVTSSRILVGSMESTSLNCFKWIKCISANRLTGLFERRDAVDALLGVPVRTPTEAGLFGSRSSRVLGAHGVGSKASSSHGTTSPAFRLRPTERGDSIGVGMALVSRWASGRRLRLDVFRRCGTDWSQLLMDLYRAESHSQLG